MSEQTPKFAPCEIEMAFGDGDHLFRLRLKQIAELQEKCKAGIGTIYRRVLTGEYYIEDVTETVRLGLVGGGMDATKARTLMERYFDDLPVEMKWMTAQAVLGACVVGYSPPGDEPGKAETAENKTDGSTSPSQSETEPSPGDTASSKPETSHGGHTARSSTSGAKSTSARTKSSRPSRAKPTSE